MSKETSSIELITPEIAKGYLTRNEGNRPFVESNFNTLVKEMKCGNFKFTGEAIQFNENGDLINDQHRLRALIKANKSYRFNVVRGVEQDAFKCIDTGEVRKAKHVYGMAGIPYPNRMSAMATLIINHQNGFILRRDKVTNSVSLNFAEKHKEKMLESMEFGYSKENKVVPKTLLSVAHYIFSKIDAETANDFCWKVASGDSVAKSSPAFLLREKLILDLRSTRKMKATERVALIFKAWNLTREKKTVKILKWDSIKEPFPKPL